MARTDFISLSPVWRGTRRGSWRERARGLRCWLTCARVRRVQKVGPASLRGPAIAGAGPAAAGAQVILVGNPGALGDAHKRRLPEAAPAAAPAAGGRRSSNFMALRNKIATELKSLIGVPLEQLGLQRDDGEDEHDQQAANARKTEAQRVADRERVRMRRAVRVARARRAVHPACCLTDVHCALQNMTEEQKLAEREIRRQRAKDRRDVSDRLQVFCAPRSPALSRCRAHSVPRQCSSKLSWRLETRPSPSSRAAPPTTSYPSSCSAKRTANASASAERCVPLISLRTCGR